MKEQISHRIFIKRKGKLVDIESLPEKERKSICEKAFLTMADTLMQSQGYERIEK